MISKKTNFRYQVKWFRIYADFDFQCGRWKHFTSYKTHSPTICISLLPFLWSVFFCFFFISRVNFFHSLIMRSVFGFTKFGASFKIVTIKICGWRHVDRTSEGKMFSIKTDGAVISRHQFAISDQTSHISVCVFHFFLLFLQWRSVCQ